MPSAESWQHVHNYYANVNHINLLSSRISFQYTVINNFKLDVVNMRSQIRVLFVLVINDKRSLFDAMWVKCKMRFIGWL